MAYAQWASFKVLPVLCDIKISDIKLKHGKLHKKDKKDDEVAASTINGTLVEDSKDFTFYTCGRSDTAAGTEGEFSLYYGEEKIATIYWDCPWSSKKNSCALSKKDGFHQFLIELDGVNADSGALGNISITIMKKPS